MIHRAIVTDNDDTNAFDSRMGRVKIDIDEIGIKGVWAYPVFSYAGNNTGFIALPDVDSLVWVEEWQGEWVWLGCCPIKGEYPSESVPKVKIFKTSNNIIVLDDDNNEIRLGEAIKGVVRLDDAVKSTIVEDSKFWTWLAGFITIFQSWTPVPMDGGLVLKTLLTAYLAANPVPSSLTGKTIESSSKVKAE